jgi:hypothetical protein
MIPTQYMGGGLPATGTITFVRMPNTQPMSAATLSVTIGANTYQWTPVGSPTPLDFFGSTANQMAQTLVAVINGQTCATPLTANGAPVKSHYAMFNGATVFLVASIPGLAGNSIGVSATSSDAGCFTLSGATLAGGVSSFPNVNRGAFLVAPPNVANGQVQLSTTSKPFQIAFIYGASALGQVGSTAGYTATANTATVYVGESIGGRVYYTDQILNSLVPTIMLAPTNTFLDLVNFWLLTPTSRDSCFVKYA